MPGSCSRREFFTAAALTASAVALRPQAAVALLARQVPQPLPLLRIGVVLREAHPAYDALRRGIHLGYAEAAYAAGMFGGSVALRTALLGNGPPARAIRVLGRERCNVIVGGLVHATDALEAIAAARGGAMIYLNAACTADAIRGIACGQHGFHVCASDAMRTDAIRQAGAGRTSTVLAWHADLYRYGAEQLNDRFTARFQTAMDEQAWYGWMAGKVAWEAVLRSGSNKSTALAAFLPSARAVFDGHKGVGLRFSRAHQLSQPLYVGPKLSEVRTPMHAAPAVPTCDR